MNTWGYLSEDDEDEKFSHSAVINRKAPLGIQPAGKQPNAKTTPAKRPDPETSIRNKLLQGAKKAEVKRPEPKQPTPVQVKPAAEPQQPINDEKTSPPPNGHSNTIVRPKTPQAPKKPNRPILVSEEAKADNDGMVNTIVNKAGEMNGLPPIIDIMVQDDPLGGKAVSDDFANRLAEKDPEVARQYQKITNPIFRKHANAIQQAEAEQEAKYQRELEAYNQYTQTRTQVIEEDIEDDTLDGGTGQDQVSDQLSTSDTTDNNYEALAIEDNIDEIDFDFTHGREGFELEAKPPTKRDGSLINQRSGVTLGYGVDLGQMNEYDLNNLVKKYGLSQSLADKLKVYLGKQGDEALRISKEHPLTLSQSEAEQLSKAKYSETLVRLENNFDSSDGENKFADLHPALKTVIFSVSVQYGPNLASSTPNFWDAVVRGDTDAIISILRDFKDNYQDRHDLEADYLEKHLK